MATLGQALNALLQANGVPGDVAHIEGGPSTLVVTYRRRDLQGRRETGTHVMTLDLHADARPAGPIQHGSIEQLLRDADGH